MKYVQINLSAWQRLLIKYKLVKNKFLKRLYKHREKWAKPYFMNIFCAGMTSTQRSESANHMLKGYIQKSAPMHQFVSKFNELLADRHDQEGTEQHDTKMVNRRLRVGVPIEKHAYSVYTRSMYEHFYDELFQSGSLTIKEKSGPSTYTVLDSSDEDHMAAEFEVTLPDSETATCTCGLFEHMGILCKHALKVLVHLDYKEIPKNNIMPRWTRDAAVTPITIASTNNHTTRETVQAMKRTLLMKALEVVNRSGDINEDAFVQAMQALTAAKSNNIAAGPAGPQGNGNTDDKENSMPVHCSRLAYKNNNDGNDHCLPLECPERTYKGGRPQGTGLNACISRQRRSARKTGSSSLPIETTWPDEEHPANKKTKRLADL